MIKELAASFTTEQRGIVKKGVVAAYNDHVSLPSFIKGMGPSRIEKSIDNFFDNQKV